VFLIEFESFARVVVSTQNLIMHDYFRKTGGLWLQDFPLKSERIATNDFENTLHDYLQRQKAPAELLQRVALYNYSSARVILVSSVPGYHRAAQLENYGHAKLRRVLGPIIAELPDELRNATLLLQFSSIGSLSADFVHKELASSLARANQPLRFVWPTCEFVRSSIDGYSAGGSLCFPGKNLRDFMQPILARYSPHKGREHLTPHIKSYTLANMATNRLAWVVLSSSNMSKAAHGSYLKSKAQSCFMVRHFEIGCLFLPRGEEIFRSGASASRDGATLTFPLPFKIPVESYTANDKPWIWDVPHEMPDSRGRKWFPR
jgi:tyrosyl-DNA phosphodiesterase-1